MKAVTAEQMRRIDERAQSEFGIPAHDLMHEAGIAVAHQVRHRYSPRRVCVICGKGNNGGDGFVAARELHTLGVQVDVVALSPAASLAPTAAWAYERLRLAGVKPVGPDQLVTLLTRADVVVDAVLGIGVRGPAEGVSAQAILAMNCASVPVIAVDVPSGLGESGLPADAPITRATLTVTIGAPKIALLTMPGADVCGELSVEAIQFPRQLLEESEFETNWVPAAELASWIPARQADSNKGDYGRVGIVAGSAPFAGAAILMARGALRAGCGLVYIFTTRELNPIFKVTLPEAVSVLVSSRSPDWLDESSLEAVVSKAGQLDALAIGPGLGTGPPQKELVKGLVQRLPGTPLVLDADAVTALSPESGTSSSPVVELLRERNDCILTPHPGEMARLLGSGTTSAEVQANRLHLARNFARSTGTNLLLKGASSVLARPDGQIYVVPGGEAALAKAGTGDVLTGCLAALVAQGVEPWKAAVLGASVHLQSGRRCARQHGSHGVLASEVADAFPQALEQLSHHLLDDRQ